MKEMMLDWIYGSSGCLIPGYLYLKGKKKSVDFWRKFKQIGYIQQLHTTGIILVEDWSDEILRIQIEDDVKRLEFF